MSGHRRRLSLPLMLVGLACAGCGSAGRSDAEMLGHARQSARSAFQELSASAADGVLTGAELAAVKRHYAVGRWQVVHQSDPTIVEAAFEEAGGSIFGPGRRMGVCFIMTVPTRAAASGPVASPTERGTLREHPCFDSPTPSPASTTAGPSVSSAGSS